MFFIRRARAFIFPFLSSVPPFLPPSFLLFSHPLHAYYLFLWLGFLLITLVFSLSFLCPHLFGYYEIIHWFPCFSYPCFSCFRYLHVVIEFTNSQCFTLWLSCTGYFSSFLVIEIRLIRETVQSKCAIAHLIFHIFEHLLSSLTLSDYFYSKCFFLALIANCWPFEA